MVAASAYRLQVNSREKDELSLFLGRSTSKVIETDLKPPVGVSVKLVVCRLQVHLSFMAVR